MKTTHIEMSPVLQTGSRRGEDRRGIEEKVMRSRFRGLAAAVCVSLGALIIGAQASPALAAGNSTATAADISSDIKVVAADVGYKNGETVTDEKSEAVYVVTDTTARKVSYKRPLDKTKTSITIPATIRINGMTCKVTGIAANAFKNNKKLKSIKIGSNVTLIDSKAFYKCTSLTSVTIPNNVRRIGTSAFEGCTKLKKVTLGKKLTTIDKKAFYKCTALTSLTFPSKVKTLGVSAFEGCKKLKRMIFQGTRPRLKTVGANAFKNIDPKVYITFPKARKNTYTNIFNQRGVKKTAKLEYK